MGRNSSVIFIGNLQPTIDPDVHAREFMPYETRVPIASGGASSDK